MNDYPEELYAPIDPATGNLLAHNTQPDFDSFPEGSPVAIYVFSGTATVKVRREALLMDEDNKIVRGPNPTG